MNQFGNKKMAMANKGKTVKLFFEEGNHHGIIHAEMMNWTGYTIYVVNRNIW